MDKIYGSVVTKQKIDGVIKTKQGINGSVIVKQHLDGAVATKHHVSGSIITKQTINGVIGFPFEINQYDGKYEVIPTVEGEVLGTTNKKLIHDITVHPIPYAEVDNPSGGITVNIAFEE